MAGVTGIAREAAAILPKFGFETKFVNHLEGGRLKRSESHDSLKVDSAQQTITIHLNTNLVRRVCAVILEVTQRESPQFIKDRLEAAGIRSLNNLIDITNYIMLETGHPTHVFDYDRLTTKKLIIREARKGEKIITLDNKEHTLQGGDIVADNGKEEIVDLLGIMGTKNSVVTGDTKRVLFFLDNNDPIQMRKTSMSLAIRTDAAAINEKNVDPELSMPALTRGIELYQKTADAKIISDIIDIYPQKWKPKTITVSQEKINQIIGVDIPLKQSVKMLQSLGFTILSPLLLGEGQGEVKPNRKISNNTLKVTIPSFRDADINIPEDLIEEIARMYGYHNLPNKLPPQEEITPHHYTNKFFWENQTKKTLKHWGFTEIYTYSMVSKNLLTVPVDQAVTIKNPLDEDHVYMRTTLIPNLLEFVNENKSREDLKIFELANTYHKNANKLPDEIQTLAGIVKGKNETFFTVKGIIEQLAENLGIKNLHFEQTASSTQNKIQISLEKEFLGLVEIHTKNLITFELNFNHLLQHATLKKTYTPLPKYPPILEDLALIIDPSVKTGNIIKEIQNQSALIKEVTLLDKFKNTRTFHIIYQSAEKNLTDKEVGDIRQKILQALKTKFNAKLKE
jgi:phenylalanyl-tRNA synthetase beta chain